jgi:prefoldin subunit 5
MVNQGFQQGNDLQKDIQIISLKLDSIKSELDAMNQRIKNIEAIAQKEQGGQRQKWY